MNYEELKEFCSKKVIKLFKEGLVDKDFVKRFKQELYSAEIMYKNGRNLYEELETRKQDIDDRYIIPYLLGFTSSVSSLPLQYIQVKKMVGSPDYDADMSPSGKEAVKKYLQEKYGEDHCMPVSAFSTLGVSSAAKDLLRLYKIDFKASNDFTTSLDSTLSWEENLEILKANNSIQYQFYLKNKEVLDKVPYFIDKVRQVSVHAGGIVITDEPVYKYCPVDRVGEQIVTAFPESGSDDSLDRIGVIKLDNLSVSILDVIKSSIDLIDEELYLIKEDGIEKIVPQSYIDNEISKF